MTITIRPALPPDAARLNSALARLSAALGDSHRATDALVLQAGFGPHPAFHAGLAERGAELVGAVVFSPLLSTTRGMAGAYVSDLWVAQGAQGAGLGRRLLAHAARRGAALWGGGFLRLASYDANDTARAFYARLGFAQMAGETALVLQGAGFDALTEGP